MKYLNFIGVDPGLATLGVTRATVSVEGHVSLQEVTVFRTSASQKKQKILVREDTVRRAQLVSAVLNKSADKSIPLYAICSESMSFPRNSSSAAKIAMCWGMLVALSTTRDAPIIQASPQEIKMFLCGRKDASKKQVAAAVQERVDLDIEKSLLEQSIPATAHEHGFDAVAALLTCLQEESVRLSLRRGALLCDV